MPHWYTVHCPAIPSHRVDWMLIPAAYQSLPLMAPGKPGRNPELVKHLQRCASCAVRFIVKP
jgi:hypothetical protein